MSEARESLLSRLCQKMEMPVWWVLLVSLRLVYEGVRGLL